MKRRDLSALEAAKIEALTTAIASFARGGMERMLQELDEPMRDDDAIHMIGSSLRFGITKKRLLPKEINILEVQSSVENLSR